MEIKTVPNHIAIIPDGNRRWAKANGLDPLFGHEHGSERFWDVSDALFTAGVRQVTVWAASIDNFTNRTPIEVRFLVTLMKRLLSDTVRVERFVEKKVRVRVVGKWRELAEDPALAAAIEHLEMRTQHFSDKTITILFGYNGTDEMLEAMKALAQAGGPITVESVKQHLWTGYLPDVDLVIRTGGEPHWSAGFMMWLTANSQFYFTPTLWPDFDEEEAQKSLTDYASRQRRFGK